MYFLHPYLFLHISDIPSICDAALQRQSGLDDESQDGDEGE